MDFAAWLSTLSPVERQQWESTDVPGNAAAFLLARGMRGDTDPIYLGYDYGQLNYLYRGQVVVSLPADIPGVGDYSHPAAAALKESAAVLPDGTMLVPLEAALATAQATYRGGGGRFGLDPVLTAFGVDNPYLNPTVKQETVFQAGPFIAMAALGAVAVMGVGVAAAEGATVAAAEGGAIVATGETVAAPVVASEFSLAGGGSGAGIGGEAYGLGLSQSAAGVGLQIPAGSAELLAPALTNPFTYAQTLAAPALAQAGQVKTVADAVKPALALGRAVRSLLGGDAPGAADRRVVTLGPGAAPVDSFASDALWTAGTIAGLFLLFSVARL